MENARLGFFARLWLAIWLPWKILFNSLFAARIKVLVQADRARRVLPPADTTRIAEAERMLAEAAAKALPGKGRAESGALADAAAMEASAAEARSADADADARTEAALADLAAREARAGRSEAAPAPGKAAPAPEEAPPAPRKVESARVDPASALQLLSVLQRDGRFVDFLQEDVASYSDAEIGAAARVVHEGCKKALTQYVVLEPVRGEAEGAPIEVPAGFDPSTLRLTGNVVGRPPFKGRLAHHGWRAAEVKLPAPAEGTDTAVVAPAEVEL